MARPQFAPAADEAVLGPLLDPLLSDGGGHWQLTPDGHGLERSFAFKTFAKAWDFMTAVSLQCKIHNHHPEWSNTYNTTFIRWTTHNPPGLTHKDITMAILADRIASDFTELEPQLPSSTARNLADAAAASARGCCGAPKK